MLIHNYVHKIKLVEIFIRCNNCFYTESCYNRVTSVMNITVIELTGFRFSIDSVQSVFTIID